MIEIVSTFHRPVSRNSSCSDLQSPSALTSQVMSTLKSPGCQPYGILKSPGTQTYGILKSPGTQTYGILKSPNTNVAAVLKSPGSGVSGKIRSPGDLASPGSHAAAGFNSLHNQHGIPGISQQQLRVAYERPMSLAVPNPMASPVTQRQFLSPGSLSPAASGLTWISKVPISPVEPIRRIVSTPTEALNMSISARSSFSQGWYFSRSRRLRPDNVWQIKGKNI